MASKFCLLMMQQANRYCSPSSRRRTRRAMRASLRRRKPSREPARAHRSGCMRSSAARSASLTTTRPSVLPPAVPDGSRSYRQSFLAVARSSAPMSGLRGCAPRRRLARSCATSSCVSGDARTSSTRCRSRDLQARAGSVCPTATTFSPRFRTATGTSSTVPRTSSPLRNLISEELPNARGPGYASRAPTPTPTSTSRTTA
mmetsp:Transcript_33747/g.85778  ORF Transcript_33747/g.85778 Transcript_33747/m.85778 type:complete len:201 (-) Transcript_33747:253-855(-)